MDKQARLDAFEIFKTGGYEGSQEEFIELISTNQDAFSDSLTMFKEGGYEEEAEDYIELLGLDIGGNDSEPVKDVDASINIDTSIPNVESEVNVKYDDYLKLLLKNPERASWGLSDYDNEEISNEITIEDINTNQNIAKDENGNILKGQELLEHIKSVDNDKKKLLKLVNTQGDEIEYAQQLKNIQLSTIPSEEEILAKVSMEGFGTNSSAQEDIVEGDASNELLMNLVKSNKDETFDLKLPNQANISQLIQDQKQKQQEKTEQEQDVFNLGSSMQSETTLQPKINLENQSGLNLSTSQVAENELKSFNENYKQTHVELKRGAEDLGLKITSNKNEADKDPDKYFYLPTSKEVETNADIVKDIKYNDKVFDRARYLTNRNKIASERINSKETRKELDEILNKFEDEKGVSGWNNVVNAYSSLATGFGLGKSLMENTLGLTIDELLGMKEGSREAYKQNQKELADAIGLSQKGDDFKIASTIHSLRNQANNLLTEEAGLKKLQNKISEDPNRTQEDIDNFYKLRDELLLTQKQIQANYEYLGNLQFEGTNVSEILNKTKKSYDQLNVLENIFLNSGVRIATGLASLKNEMSYVNMLEFAGVNLRDENVRKQYAGYVEDIFGETASDISEGIMDIAALKDEKADQVIANMSAFGEGLLNEVKEQQRFDEIDTVMDGLLWGTEMMTGQILNTGMSIMIPGGAGLILSSLSESGNQMYDMKKRIDGVKWSDEESAYIKKYKEEFGYNPYGDDDVYKVKPEDINALQFYGTAGVYGAAEYLSEKITLGNFKMGAKNIRKAFDLSKAAKKGMPISNRINQRFINLKEASKDFLKGVPGEAIGEGAVTLSQNFAEIHFLNNEDVSLMDGMTESMMSGLVMSGTMQGPGLMAQTYQAFRGPDRNAKVSQRGADILRLSNSIKSKELQLAGLKPTDSKFKDITQSIQLENQQLHSLAKQQLEDQNNVRSEIASMDPSTRQSLINIFNAEHDVRNKIDKINDNKSLDPKVAEDLINAESTKLVELEAVKNYQLANASWNADKARAKNFSNAYRAKNGTLGDVEMIVGNNNKEALAAGLKFVDSRNDLTSEEKNQVKEQMREQFEIAEIASRGDSTVNGMAFGDNLTIKTTDANNVTTEKTLNIPMTFAMNKNNLTVQSHEIGHHTLFKEFIENNPDAVGLVEDLESYVKKNYSEAYQNFIETKELYKDKSSELLAEEKLARLSDFMRQSQLTGSDMGQTMRNKIFGRFQKFNDGSGQIRTGKDVFDMLVSFNESFETGRLTGLTKSIAEGTADISRKKKGVKKTSESKLSLTKAERSELTDLTNESPGVKGPDGKYKMTKAEFLQDKNKAFSNVYTAISQGKFDGLIIDKMASGKTIYDKSREDVIQETQDKLADHLMNFDPTQSGSLFGWINSYIGKRVGDVTNKAKRDKAKQPGRKISTDQKIGEEGRTIGETIADDVDIEADIDANIVEDTIDNMRTKLGIEKGGPVYNKVLDSVRKVFGTKLPEVSNKKFREDLKKAFDKELFKEIKKFIGTRANYETFLSENFQTVFDAISQSTANKRFRQFVEPLIDPKTGKQARPDNNPLFRKRDVKRSEFMDYFLGKDVGASTKGTRKDALAGAIAQELAFDATMEVLQDPAIQNRIKDIYELQGLRQAENYTAVVGKNIDRAPGSKFNITKDGNVKDNSIVIDNAVTFLESAENDVRSGKDPEVIIDNYYNKLSPEDQNVLSPYINDIKADIRAIKKGKVDINTFREAMAARNVLGKGIGLNYYTNVKDWRSQSGLPSQELNKDGSIKQAGLNPIDTTTKEGEARYLDNINEFTKSLDSKFLGLSLFMSTLNHGGNIIFDSGGTRINKNKKEVPSSAGSTDLIRSSFSSNNIKDFNVNTKIAKSVDKKMGKVEQLVVDTVNDPNFDQTNPKDQAKLAAEINKIITPEQKAAIEATRDYFFNKLNDYVNSFPVGSPAYYNAVDFAIAVLQGQSSATSGITRQGATLNSVTMAFSDTSKPFQREHNLQNLNFNFNVLNSILDNSFDKNYETLASTYHQSLLDTDAQKVLDGQMTTEQFNKKYGTTLNKDLLKQIAGKTKGLPDFLSGMNSESMFALALGNAGQTLMLEFGTTLDQVLFNQIAGKKGLDYLKNVSKELKSKFSKSPMGNSILNPKNESAIFESKENKDLFNKAISEVVNGQNIDNTSIELGIKLENKDNYDQRDKVNNDQLNNSGVVEKFSKTKKTTKDVVEQSNKLDKALDNARDPKAPIKKIRVFDFDDTLARTKSNVFYTMPDGTKGTLTAEEFAEKGGEILNQGGEFDFSDFNIVRDGKPGPLLDVAKKIQKARGTEDVFVLTARAPESQLAIKEFLDSVGLNIPLQNITGLGNSTGLAKANWIVDKAAEGYNDFYFADDAIQNVQAVKDALSVIDVKSAVQQAKIKFSKTIDQTVNDMLEHKFGIKSEAEYSDVKARLKGRKKGRFKLFIPPSAEDFVGLLYSMLGKGEIGNMQMDFFNKHLIEPYGRAMENLSRDQNRMINDFTVLKKQLVEQGLIPKNLNKIALGEFTHSDVARILAWNKQGMEIPGISKSDLKQVLAFAKKNPAIDVFAQNLIDINKGDGYAAPTADWLAGTISTDLLDGLRTGKRGKYLQQWQNNVNLIFSPKNLNKMEAALGTNWREAMENILGRMKSGRNRSNQMGKLENRLLDYINNSVGTVMFFNMRSALLQMISSVNFIDFGSNNIFRAAQAFANQPQYWKDFMELMNSEFLVERRNGLKLNVSESEIADAAATSKNKAKAAIAYILQKGYLPTQFADSFAIATGGATFYRNRIKALMKEGMNEADAKKQAFLEFREIAEESQQSSRPDRVSQQQSSTLGRLILAFQNTPMQMNRLGKKAFLDLKNRRKRPGMTQFQSDMSNASRVTYYFAVQSAIFSALQQALFALAFNDDEEEKEKERYYNIANGMLNTLLNGTGIMGVAASTLISVGRKVYKESKKEGQFPGPNYEDAANEMLNFSPPIDIKLSKLRQSGLTWKYEGYKHDEAKWGIDDPAWKSAAYAVSGLTNVPLDRLISKAENVRSAIEDEQQTWKRVSLLLGWKDYQLNSTEEKQEYIMSQKKAKAAYRDKMKKKGSRQYFPKSFKQDQKEKEFNKYKNLKKPKQVQMLDSLGLSKKQIRNLQYEKDRVAKIIELMNK